MIGHHLFVFLLFPATFPALREKVSAKQVLNLQPLKSFCLPPKKSPRPHPLVCKMLSPFSLSAIASLSLPNHPPLCSRVALAHPAGITSSTIANGLIQLSGLAALMAVLSLASVPLAAAFSILPVPSSRGRGGTAHRSVSGLPPEQGCP